MTSMTNPDALVEAVFEAIAHGDEQHRAWLKESLGGILIPLLQAREAAAKEQAERLAEALEYPIGRALAFAAEAGLSDEGFAGRWRQALKDAAQAMIDTRAALAAWEKSRG